ncbi:hepatic and glial cell adhesion molecule-like [Hyla sarda]|uniref:hepatic and glial cell adhesion molecule-like n=1 Tax=Hyla sarda TaxID=327740 RepID=UPI0024C30842|nr:hepatic and glial cell adhesion molecule-like [Hyla sarda]
MFQLRVSWRLYAPEHKTRQTTRSYLVQRHKVLLPIMERAPRLPFMLPLILLVASGIVTPVVSMFPVNGRLGYSVDFDIPVPLPTEHRIYWNFGHAGQVTVITKLASGDNPMYHPLYRGRCQLFNNGTLRLNNISYADQGTYKLKLFNPSNFTSYIQDYRLGVYEILSTPVLRSTGRLVTGTNVTLQCDAGVQNVTTYTFYRDQTPICSEPNVICRGSSLYFTPISENDSGSYTCNIQNPISNSTSHPTQWTVYTAVSGVTLTSNTSEELWAGQDSASLHCTAQGSAINLSWSLNGNPVSPNPPYYITQSGSPPKSTLTISPLSKYDNGPFTCTASNIVNSETSNELNLDLKWYPEGNIACTAQANDENMLQLDCSWPGGQPAANVTMIFNNIEEAGQNEITKNVALSQSTEKSNLTCVGDHLGNTFACSLIFGTPLDLQQTGKSEAVP